MTLVAAPTDLSGKTCLVTGANGGIGQATAEHFAALGARVLTTDIGEAFDGACASDHRAFDLASEDGLAGCCEWIAAEAPDVLFNNAALFDMGSVLEAGLEQYDRLFGQCAMYAVMQAVANALVTAAGIHYQSRQSGRARGDTGGALLRDKGGRDRIRSRRRWRWPATGSG